jgi:DnaJ-class molecular chaperone
MKLYTEEYLSKLNKEKRYKLLKEIMQADEKDGLYEDNMCIVCNGSGEGMWDGSTCSSCKGLGIKIREDI